MDCLSHIERTSKSGISQRPDRRILRMSRTFSNCRWDGKPDRQSLGAPGRRRQLTSWGQFDGRTFRPDKPQKSGSGTAISTPPQTYDNAPEGRRVQIGWGTRPSTSQGIAVQPADGAFPSSFRLRTTTDGPADVRRAGSRNWPGSPRQGKNLVKRRSGGETRIPLANVRGRASCASRPEIEPGSRPEAVGFVIRGVPRPFTTSENISSSAKEIVGRGWPPIDGRVHARDRGPIAARWKSSGNNGRVALSVGRPVACR